MQYGLSQKTRSINHYPFGSIVESRSWKGDYRYGFNGKETDSETFEGVVAYEARIYDSRIGRFFSTDPREAEYAWQSTYVYFMNSPIAVLDYNGMGSDDDPPENGSERTVDGCTEYYNDNEGWTSDATTLREAVATAARPRAKESKPLSNRAISFLDKASDYIPFVGGLKQIGRSYNADDGKGAGIGAGEVALDALLLASTGGIGNLIKSGIKAVVKTVAKESVQNYIGGQVSEGLDDAGIPIGAQVVVGVTLGIHKKPNNTGGKMGNNKKANRMFADIVASTKIQDKHAFSDFLHKEKSRLGKGGADNFSWQELEELSVKYFKQGGK